MENIFPFLKVGFLHSINFISLKSFITSLMWEEDIFASLDNLIAVLKMLVKNRGILRKYKENSRLWIEKNWHPKDKCQKYVDVYRELLNDVR